MCCNVIQSNHRVGFTCASGVHQLLTDKKGKKTLCLLFPAHFLKYFLKSTDFSSCAACKKNVGAVYNFWWGRDGHYMDITFIIIAWMEKIITVKLWPGQKLVLMLQSHPGKQWLKILAQKKKKILQPRVMNLKSGCSEGKDQVCEHL